MATALVTPATSEPVNIDDVRAQCKMGDAQVAANPQLVSLAIAARRWVESYTGQRLVTQTWDIYFDDFPAVISLPFAPLAATTPISYIHYIDEAGAEQILSASSYTVDQRSMPPRLTPAYQYQWPSTQPGRTNAVIVRAIFGYGEPGTVPDEIRWAILMLCEHWYDSPDGVAGDGIAPQAVISLLNPYRVTV